MQPGTRGAGIIVGTESGSAGSRSLCLIFYLDVLVSNASLQFFFSLKILIAS